MYAGLPERRLPRRKRSLLPAAARARTHDPARDLPVRLVNDGPLGRAAHHQPVRPPHARAAFLGRRARGAAWVARCGGCGGHEARGGRPGDSEGAMCGNIGDDVQRARCTELWGCIFRWGEAPGTGEGQAEREGEGSMRRGVVKT